MSNYFRNHNKVVLALPAISASRNDDCGRGRGRGRRRIPNMPPRRREVLPKWENHGKRRPYSRRPRRNHDTICLICGDGREGEFIGCANCLSTYHTSCVDKQGDTSTKLLCPYCICRYCGDINEYLVTCCQCHKKFHWECLQANEKDFVIETLNCVKSYCEPNCKLIHEKMEVSLGVKYYINEKYSWRIVRKMDNDLLDSKNLLEINSKVELAGVLMCGAFEKIIDTHTGIDIVQNVVYSCGSKWMRVNFNRFHTFVIEEDDVIIATALIRFNGREIAEMSFIATVEAHKGKGICRLLMAEIESFLRGLEIKSLIIPSPPEFIEMWKGKYDFDVVNIGSLKKIISSCNMLMFPNATRLYKDLYRRPLVDVDLKV